MASGRGQCERDEEDAGVGGLGDADVAHPARLGSKDCGLGVGPPEQLDQHRPAHLEALLHDHVHLAVEVVALLGQRADALADEAGRDEEEGDEDEGGQGDLPAEEEHGTEDDDHRDEVADHVGEQVGEGLLGADHVVVQPADQGPGLGAGEEGQRHPLDVAEHLGAHVVDEALPDVGRDPPLGQGQAGVGEGQDGDQESQLDHQVGVVLEDAVVDQGPQDQGVHGADGGVEDDHGEEDGQDRPVGDGEGEHPPGRALLDPVLEDGAVLAHGAHAAPAAAATASHAVAPHTHACNLPSEVRQTWSGDSESVRSPSRRDSVGADAPGHRHGGLEHDLQVPPQRPRGHVEVVELHEVVAGQVVAPRDLPQARDARSHLEAARRPTLDVGLAGDERARAHDGHVALEDVDELGDLVDAGPAQERPEAGDAARLVLLVAQLVQRPVGILRLGCRFSGTERPRYPWSWSGTW